MYHHKTAKSKSTNSPLKHIEVIVFLCVVILAVVVGLGAYTFDFRSRATGTPANITVHVNEQRDPMDVNFAHAFAQGGEEKKDMLAPIATQVKVLKPHYIRIDHLYDYYNVLQTDGSYDFRRLDEVVATIRKTGATPFFSLSYFPQNFTIDGTVVGTPNSWGAWSALVQKTIEHYSGRGGLNIPNIYYEVWNEPDLSQFGSWKLQGGKNYLELYRATVKGAATAQNVQPYFIGGPATTALYKNWIEALIKSGDRVDFLSWHSYSDDPVKIKEELRDARQWTRELGRPDMPLLITENGFTSQKDSRYGTAFGAAYTASLVRELLDIPPTYLFTFQLKDGPAQTDGWGILGHEDTGAIIKPRYTMFPFLDRLVGNRIVVEGEGSWVRAIGSRHNGVIQLLLVNYDPEGRHVETVPILFKGLKEAEYTLRRSALMGSEVEQMIKPIALDFSLSVYLPVNGVLLLELTPKL